MKLIVNAGVIFFTLLLSTVTKADCLVSNEKKEIIQNFLCGQYSDEPSYKFSGVGCVTKSVKARMFDTAVHITSLKACGYNDFAEDYLIFNKKIFSATQPLLQCTNENVDYLKLLDTSLNEVKLNAGSSRCDGEIKIKIDKFVNRTKPQLNDVSSQNIGAFFLKSLKVVVDNNGNLRDF